MRRVVVTGIGIVSSIGNNKHEVTESLRSGRPGIVHCDEYAELNLRSHVHGALNLDPSTLIDRKLYRFMGDAAAYAYIGMKWAIEDAGLEESDVSNPRTGLIASSGGASSENIIFSADTLRSRGVKRIGPYMVPRTMSSSVSACLATPFKIKGINYSITSACATSAHCIGAAAEQIQLGKQDVVFAGGGEEEGTDSIEAKIEARNAARKARNFEEADRIRDELEAEGVFLEDGPEGTTWRRVR